MNMGTQGNAWNNEKAGAYAVKNVTGAVAATGLIRLTAVAHGAATGDLVFVDSVGGVPNAQGYWVVTAVDVDTLDLQGSVFAGTYTSGGTVTTGVSRPVDTGGAANVQAFGNSGGATTISLQVSQDAEPSKLGAHWYDAQDNQVLAGAGDFEIDSRIGARFVRLKNLTARTITATITAKR